MAAVLFPQTSVSCSSSEFETVAVGLYTKIQPGYARKTKDHVFQSMRGSLNPPTCMALDTEGVQDQAVPIVSKILDTMGTNGALLGRTAGPGVPTRPRGSVDTPWSPGR